MINDASLVMIPSGYKDGKLYSVKPTNGSGDFTFSRGSNLAATRVNSEGLIEKGRENLLLQSNTFSTTWTNSNTSVTSGQSGYDGSTDAWQLTATSTGSSRIIGQNNTTTAVSTFSVYAKAGNINYLALENGTDFAYISLIDGSIGNSGGTYYIGYSSTNVGDGWWRVSITFNKVASSNLRIYLASSGTSTAVNSGDYIYIQDAQLEQGLVATDYIETTTTTAQAGILEDMPRLNYGTCPSLLLEPQRTNLLSQSEYANSSNWANGGTTYTNNSTTSPDGGVNAIKLIEDNSTAFHYLGSQTSTSTSGSYTISGFVKKGSRRYAGLRAVTNGFVNRYFVLVDLDNGTVADTNTFGSGVTWSNTITAYANGWYRIQISGTHTSGIIDATFGLSDSDSPSYIGGLPTYNGSSGEYAYCYGLQIESGSYPTSYIPTYGASVTRGVDTAINYNNANLPTAYPFSLYAEINVTDTSTGYVVSFLDSSVSNFYYTIEYFSNAWHITSRPSGSTTRVSSTTAVTLGTHKLLGIYTDTTMTLYLDGTLIASGSNSQTFNSTINDLLLGQLRTSGDTGTRNSILQALVFNTELSSDEAIALTS